jgi:16S rRNA (guanine966-N2)-methyltransferase
MPNVRIIAGTWKGRRLKTPQGNHTRPTPDRVKEALFSIIAAHLPQAHVLDLFAGTGALGLEALSRGSSKAVFVESHPQALVALKENTQHAQGASKLLACDFNKALPLLRTQKEVFNLVFIDPPYAQGLWHQALEGLHAYGLLQKETLVVCEHSPEGMGAPVPAYYHVATTRMFGDVCITLLLYTAEGL